MKLIYSQLQKLLPDLNVVPQKLRDDLTMIGHFTNYFEEIENEIVFDLDIKVNRGDCLGYFGIAKDLGVYYNIPLLVPQITLPKTLENLDIPIEIKSNDVKRVLALKLSNIKVADSPEWLKKVLSLHGINSINNIVDATNYIMLFYGIPSHAFDTAKTTPYLIWENNNNRFDKFTSLDGSILDLNKETLLISNQKDALSLSFIGGNNSGIDSNTQEIIVEMAIYNRSRVRKDSRSLKTVTEASIRLEKDLDTETIPMAFDQLINLIIDLGSGQITSNLFEKYLVKPEIPQIEFNAQKPSITSGINIPIDFVLDVLNRLGCKIEKTGELFLVTPPSIRPDITMEADLVEEVVRFFGYQNIPITEPLAFKDVTDITPKEIYLIDELKDKLVDLGYDEVLTWPLVSKPVDPKTVITTQNSINTESIYLRQSLIPSLQEQQDQYERLKLFSTQFFEIGKIFFQEGDKYIEKNSLGIYNSKAENLVSDLEKLGIKGKIVDKKYVEIILDDLPKPNSYAPQVKNFKAYELTSQIITLDANVSFSDEKDPVELIKHYSEIIGDKYLWQLIITDIYKDTKSNQFRYTFRASYFNIDDKTAKDIHLKSFGLKN